MLATAILDRLPHPATTLNTKGETYRPAENKGTGLLGQSPHHQPEDTMQGG